MRGPVETAVFAQKTMHLNAVLQKTSFFGENTKCFLIFYQARVLKFGRLKN